MAATPAAAAIKPIVHYRDANILVLQVNLFHKPLVQVFQRCTQHLWTATYPEDCARIWPLIEVLILDPEPLYIGQFKPRMGDKFCALYTCYDKQDESFMHNEIPVRGGLNAEKLHALYPGELATVTRRVFKCHTADEWCTRFKQTLTDDLKSLHFG